MTKGSFWIGKIIQCAIIAALIGSVMIGGPILTTFASVVYWIAAICLPIASLVIIFDVGYVRAELAKMDSTTAVISLLFNLVSLTIYLSLGWVWVSIWALLTLILAAVAKWSN